MKVLLIGYGKMGKTIERILIDRGHEISGIVNIENANDVAQMSQDADVAIEFSHPESAFDNITQCLANGTPVVSGTTGWLNQYEEACAVATENDTALFYASNFSVGVNIFFAINERLAQLMNGYTEYKAEVHETHHIHKQDAPSGTAITIAEDIIKENKGVSKWSLDKKEDGTLPIYAYREGEVYGKHTVRYDSPIDMIEITHDAHSREGFAMGAVLASEWIIGKKGIFNMRDMLGL